MTGPLTSIHFAPADGSDAGGSAYLRAAVQQDWTAMRNEIWNSKWRACDAVSNFGPASCELRRGAYGCHGLILKACC